MSAQISTWLDFVVVGSIGAFVVYAAIADTRRHRARIEKSLQRWALTNGISLDIERSDTSLFGWGGPLKVSVLGTDASGIERKYTFQVSGFWRGSWYAEPRLLTSEVLRFYESLHASKRPKA